MMSNLSKETTQMLFCSRHWDNASYLLHFYTFGMVFYVPLAITAALGNSLILVALQKDTSLHLPSKILLRSLAITNFCVGIISLPIVITFVFFIVTERWSVCRIAEYLVAVVATTFFGVSLATLTAIGVDRLLALLLRLRYRQVVTVKRTRAAICLF